MQSIIRIPVIIKSTKTQDLSLLLDSRRRELVESVRKTRDEKRKILQEQLGIIQSEKAKVEQQCTGLQYQVEVRNITRKISDLNEKLDATLTLVEPRENAFLRYDSSTEQVLRGIQEALAHFGTLSVSRTFPPLCTAEQVGSASVNLLGHVTVHTIDYNGQKRTTGEDPVEATLRPCDNKLDESQRVGVTVTDNQDGSYDLTFRPYRAGEYELSMSIFGRAIRSSPLKVVVSEHHPPVWQYDHSLSQPVKVVCDPQGHLNVLDTGNCRVLRFSLAGSCEVVDTIVESLDRSTVGLAVLPVPTNGSSGWSLLTLNWRTKTITEWARPGTENSSNATQVKSFTFSEFVEPIDLAVDARQRILVADNGALKVFVFDPVARPLFSFPVAAPSVETGKDHVTQNGSSASLISPAGSPSPRVSNGRRHQNGRIATSTTSPITSLAVGINDDILVARGHCVQLYDNTGRWLRQINLAVALFLGTPERMVNFNQKSALIGGLVVDRPTGTILATVSDRHRSFLAVCQYKGEVKFTMDSHNARLKRPSGMCLTGDREHCFVADLGNNSVKKYQFK